MWINEKQFYKWREGQKSSRLQIRLIKFIAVETVIDFMGKLLFTKGKVGLTFFNHIRIWVIYLYLISKARQSTRCPPNHKFWFQYGLNFRGKTITSRRAEPLVCLLDWSSLQRQLYHPHHHSLQPHVYVGGALGEAGPDWMAFLRSFHCGGLASLQGYPSSLSQSKIPVLCYCLSALK